MSAHNQSTSKRSSAKAPVTTRQRKPGRKQAPPSRSGATSADDDAQALIAAATSRRQSPKGVTGQARKALAKGRKHHAQSEEDEAPRETRSGSDPWAGVTYDEDHCPRRWSLSTILLCMVAVTALALSVIAWRSAPPPTAHCVLTQPAGVPRALFAQWVRGFPDSEALFSRPDLRTLESFAAYLGSQAAVREVRSIRLEPGEGSHRGQMVLQIDLALRKPILPVILATGERAWLSESGHLLPGVLDGPQGQPLVRGIEYASAAVINELVAVWPDLSRSIHAFMPGLITEIRCDAPLGSSEQLGLVFVTQPGTLLTWGNPSEVRYGVSREQRLRNLVHTLRCQGDLRRVPEINVRFHEPFAVVR